MVSKKISGTTELKQAAEPLGIAGQRPLMAAVGDPGAHDFVGGIEENNRGGVAGQQFAIGWLQKSSSTQRQHRGTPQARKEIKVMVFNGAEATFATGRKQLGNRAMGSRDLDIQVDEWAGKLKREEPSNGAFPRPHESDQNKQRN